MTPGEAVRKFCIECVGGPSHIQDVRECGGDKCLNGGCDKSGVCWFYAYRMGKGRPSVKLIRKICLWCLGGSEQIVRECWSPDCVLHPYRLGRNPARTGKGGMGKRFVSAQIQTQNPLSHTG
jgi:hypothetical protein